MKRNYFPILLSKYLLTWKNIQCYVLGSEKCVDEALSTAYQGPLSVTANGRTCQHWLAQSPHSNGFTDEDFQDEPSLNAVMNYCRDPWAEGRTWCFTTDLDIAWEYCNFPPCHCNYQPYVLYICVRNEKNMKPVHIAREK